MKKHFGTALKFTLSLGLGLFIVWFTFSRLTPDERSMMREAFANANYWWLLAGGFVNLSSNYFRTQRWRILLKPLGYNPGFANTFLSVMVMYFANLLFPRLGEVLRCGILKKYEKIPVDKSIGTMVTERIVDLITLLILGGVLVLVEKDRFYQTFSNTQEITRNFSDSPVYGYILYAALGLVALFIAYKVFTDKTWIYKIIEFIKGIFAGLKSILNTEKPLLFLFHSVVIWACYISSTYICFLALSETAAVSPLAALGVTFFGGIAYAAIQGGVGAYPLVVGKFLVLYGILDSIGLAFGWIVWTVQTALVIIGGVLSLLALSIINRS